MEKIIDLQHYSAITKDFKRHCSATLNNCFYMANDIKRLTSEGRLYFELSDCTLMIFQDEGSYWQVGFISAPDSKTTVLQPDKTCVTSLIQRNDELTDKNLALKKIAEGFGFNFIRRYRLYEFVFEGQEELLNKTLPELVKKAAQDGLQVVPFNDRYTESVSRLWNMYLDPTTISRQDRGEGINNSILVVDTNNNDRLCGVYMPKKEGGKFALWHLAVDPEYRGKMLAQLLALTLLNKAADEGYKKASNWIADDNVPSIRLHEKIGMKPVNDVSLLFKL